MFIAMRTPLKLLITTLVLCAALAGCKSAEEEAEEKAKEDRKAAIEAACENDVRIEMEEGDVTDKDERMKECKAGLPMLLSSCKKKEAEVLECMTDAKNSDDSVQCTMICFSEGGDEE